MSHTTHVQHEAKRYANEVVEIDGRIVRIRGGVLPKGAKMIPGMMAIGTLAYASIYAQGGNEKPDKPVGSWSVEVRHSSGHWITACKAMQGKTIVEARNIVKASKNYRLVRTGWNGGEIVEKL